jgi:hypothetical protein
MLVDPWQQFAPSVTWRAWALQQALNALCDAVLDDLPAWMGPHAGPLCRGWHPYNDDGSDPGNCGTCHFYHPGRGGTCGHDSCTAIAMDHACPRDAFLEDPITVAYGVGSEMVCLIDCPTCDALGWSES